MFSGTVGFVAEIKGDRRVSFPRLDFNPPEPDVDRIELEESDGDVISSTVHLRAAVSHDAGMRRAAEVNDIVLNRIAFYYSVTIENACCTSDGLVSLAPQPGNSLQLRGEIKAKGKLKLKIRSTAEQLKAELEQATPPGERHYGLFRSAFQSASPIEQFMHLYHILLMLYNDKQANVDVFIIAAEPSVPQTPSPKFPSQQETVYTRLRNEFAHRRKDVNLDKTKEDMKSHLEGLITLAKRAIGGCS